MICDATEQLDIRKLAKLAPSIPDVFEIEGERFVTDWTKTNFGGKRQWFLCPSCDRRCAIVYRIGDGPLWQCRVCGNGKYRSEGLSPHNRRIRKAIKLRKSLGQESGGLTGKFPDRPKNMHRKTYDKYVTQAIMLERRILQATVAQLTPHMREALERIKAERASGMAGKDVGTTPTTSR